MAYLGYMQLGCGELANASRVVEHLSAGCHECRNLSLGYDSTWPDLPYDDTPPWYRESNSAAQDFVGVWPMSIEGLDSIPIERKVDELICAGGASPIARDTSRTIDVEVLVVACSAAGAHYGLQWLNCQLRQATSMRGVELVFLAAHPEDTGLGPVDLWRTISGVVLTEAPKIGDYLGLGGSTQHRQASVYRVTFQLTALSPYVYGPIDTRIIAWDSTVEQPVTWVHQPDCADPGDCDLPVLFAEGCIPERVVIPPAPVPLCGGCLPLCSVQENTWTLYADPPSWFCETTVSMRITNTGDQPLTALFTWQPADSDDSCDVTGELVVNGLAPGATAVADSVGGRPYALVDGCQVRQVGVVTTNTGRPWQATTLDRSIDWRLTALTEPSASMYATVSLQSREA